MSVSQRLSENFTGEDWLLLYQAFTQINLNAYDFQTVKNSMVDYIRRNYPEDFNDWINSSEFVALIDLFAYMGGMLAFRMDLNSRENFIDTASRRESILRLARFLSYNPKRAFPATGLLKITNIRVNDDILDSSGNNLNNVTIQWDDPNNPNWFEQWVLVLNTFLISTNPWGTPLKTENVAGIPTQLYRLNNIITSAGNYPFSAGAGGSSLSFDVVNLTFDSVMGFTEREPNPLVPFHICYRSDGNGNSSSDTGFFVMFKQGSLNKSDFSIDYPIENLTLDLSYVETNETDIWVQSVNIRGEILPNGSWTRVGFVPVDDVRRVFLTGENISYNNQPLDVRKIFQIISKDNDIPMVRFGDGRLGEIPTGNLRVWFRTSSTENVYIRPDNIKGIPLEIPFINLDGNSRIVQFNLSLQTPVGNGVAAETNDEIRRRSGQVFSTQGRMVNGEDYNLLPQTMNLALKTKALNRTYSGQTRYMDLNDPTGNYQNLSVFGDDAALFWEHNDLYQEIPLSLNISTIQMVSTVLQPAIGSIELRDFLYDNWVRGSSGHSASNFYNFNAEQPYLWWQPSSAAIYTSSGRFIRTADDPNIYPDWSQFTGAGIGANGLENSYEQFIIEGAMVKFKKAGWVSVIKIINDGSDFTPTGEGWVTLNEVISQGDQVIKVLPSIRRTLTSSESNSFQTRFDSKRTFGIGFDYVNQIWYDIDSSKMDLTSEYTFATKNTARDSSWLIKCEYTGDYWRFTTRGLRYILECEKSNSFYFVNGTKVVDSLTGKVSQDNIKIIRSNSNPILSTARQWTANTYFSTNQVVYQELALGSPPVIQKSYWVCGTSHLSGTSFDTGYYDTTQKKWILLWRNVNIDLGNDYPWDVVSPYYNTSGLQEPTKVQVTLADSDFDGQPDNPESFFDIVNIDDWVFEHRVIDSDGIEHYLLDTTVKWWYTNEQLTPIDPGQIVFMADRYLNTGIFYQNLLTYRGIPNVNKVSQFMPLVDQTEYLAFKGRRDLFYQWKHYATNEYRIDPAVTNIIDIFVLTKEYYNNMLSWRSTGSPIVPKPPSPLSLKNSFETLEQYKMFSDEIVWRAVKFKLIFGDGALPEHRAKFKAVKIPNTILSDGEIKSQILQAITDFFDPTLWDFGETFYATELIGYIHRKLGSNISSIVVVPLKQDQRFGNLFEITPLPDEIFFPVIKISDIELISSNTPTNLRIR